MSGTYDRAAATALKLLTKYGRSVTVTSVTPGTYDPAAGSITNTTATSTAKGLVTEHKATDIDGTLIKAGDKKLLLDSSAVISIDDSVTVGSDVYSVVGVSELNPAGTRVMWTCNIRGSA